MKKTVLIFALLLTSASFSQTHFTPPAGNPYSPMNIFLVGASYDGKRMSVNDEVAVLDGERIVGVTVFTLEASPANPVGIIATKDDGSGNGFVDGHPITFKMWDALAQKEFTIEPTEVTFHDLETATPIDPVPFVALGTAAVSIEGESESAVESLPSDIGESPAEFRLEQNYPNPFNPSTRISYALGAPSLVKLEIFDLQGNLVDSIHSGMTAAGVHSIEWDGRNRFGEQVSSGVFLYRLTTENFVTTKKMILSR